MNAGYVASVTWYGQQSYNNNANTTVTETLTTTASSAATNSWTWTAGTISEVATVTATANQINFDKNSWVNRLCADQLNTTENTYCAYYQLFDYDMFNYATSPMYGISLN